MNIIAVYKSFQPTVFGMLLGFDRSASDAPQDDPLCLWPILASTPIIDLERYMLISLTDLLRGSPSCGSMLTVTNSFGFDTV